LVAGVALPQNPNSAPFRFSLGYHNITIPGDRSHHAPVPKHVIIDRDKEDNEYYTRLFAKEQSYRSMLRILGIDGNGFSDRKFRNVRHRYESTGFLQTLWVIGRIIKLKNRDIPFWFLFSMKQF